MFFLSSVVCVCLADAVTCGVAFHHAGLDHTDRTAIESLFASGDLPVLSKTTAIRWPLLTCNLGLLASILTLELCVLVLLLAPRCAGVLSLFFVTVGCQLHVASVHHYAKQDDM